MREALTAALIVLVPLATIGPNLGSQGLRTEHIYAIVAAVALLLLNGVPPRLTTVYWTVLLAWATVFLVALIGGLLPVGPATVSVGRTVIDGLARLGVPILGLVIGAYARFGWPGSGQDQGARAPSRLNLMMTALVLVACVNAVVAVASAVGELSWLTWFRPDEDTTMISDYAAQQGRYGGVVNQPFEAGMLYSVALLTVGRLLKVNAIGMGRFVGFSALIVLGGVSSGSKVFLLGGLPLALAYFLLASPPLRLRGLVGAGLAALASAQAIRYVLSEVNLQGLAGLSSFLTPWDLADPKSTLLAGRLDSDGRTIDEGLRVVFRDTNLFGFGASGGATGAYDIGFIEFMAVAGWVGLAAMVLIAVVLLVVPASHGRDRYWLALGLLVVGANLGGPAFTANRNALLVWVLLGAMLQCIPGSRERRG